MSIKNLSALSLVSSISLMFELLLIEFNVYTLEGLYPAVIVSVLLWAFVNGYFIYLYNHNHKSVMALKQEYINTFKPACPLRFCATDKELLDAYDKSVAEKDATPLLGKIAIKPKTTTPQALESEDEEELQMQ